MEPYGLSQALKIDQKAAKAFIDKYFEKFPGVKTYFSRITQQLDEKGYVNTFLGRKRFFPSWNKVTGFQKRILFREAINMPIQGGSSELIKIAMANIFEYLRTNNVKCTMLLQIHDELIFEADTSENLDELEAKIRSIMTSAYDIGVPLKVSMKKGRDLTFAD
jgi:DNA polymerase-1